MTHSPIKILLLLLLAAAGISGWLYGWHWKQVASGSKPTNDEELILSLQDQLDQLRADNGRLMESINELTDQVAEKNAGDGNENPERPEKTR